MEIIGPNQSVPFVPEQSTDAAYPARIGEPSVDGPIVYPEQEPDTPENVVPFQRETGLDPSKIPALQELGPKLRLLEGGRQQQTGIVPAGRIANDTNPTTMQRFAGAPEEAPAASMFSWKTLLVVGAAAAVGYFVGRSNSNTGPLIAGLDESEE